MCARLFALLGWFQCVGANGSSNYDSCTRSPWRKNLGLFERMGRTDFELNELRISGHRHQQTGILAIELIEQTVDVREVLLDFGHFRRGLIILRPESPRRLTVCGAAGIASRERRRTGRRCNTGKCCACLRRRDRKTERGRTWNLPRRSGGSLSAPVFELTRIYQAARLAASADPQRISREHSIHSSFSKKV